MTPLYPNYNHMADIKSYLQYKPAAYNSFRHTAQKLPSKATSLSNLSAGELLSLIGLSFYSSLSLHLIY